MLSWSSIPGMSVLILAALDSIVTCLLVPDTLTVTVEEAPISFSPFSLADCSLFSHFSFNDFIATAFPDLAGDLEIQI